MSRRRGRGQAWLGGPSTSLASKALPAQGALGMSMETCSRSGFSFAAVHPMCPSDGLVFPGNGYCYRLVVEKAEWLEAQQQCQEHGSGELAFVSTPEIQSFLVSRVIR